MELGLRSTSRREEQKGNLITFLRKSSNVARMLLSSRVERISFEIFFCDFRFSAFVFLRERVQQPKQFQFLENVFADHCRVMKENAHKICRD